MVDAWDTRELLPKLRKCVLKMHRCNSIEAVKHGLKGHMDFDLSLKPHIIQSVLLTSALPYSSWRILFTHTHREGQRSPTSGCSTCASAAVRRRIFKWGGGRRVILVISLFSLLRAQSASFDALYTWQSPCLVSTVKSKFIVLDSFRWASCPVCIVESANQLSASQTIQTPEDSQELLYLWIHT